MSDTSTDTSSSGNDSPLPYSMVGAAPDSCPLPPVISKFTGTVAGSPPASGSLQVPKGSSIVLSWTITGGGELTGLEMDGANQSLATKLTTLTVSPTADTTYTLHATSAAGTGSATLLVALHDPTQVVSQHAGVAESTASGPIAVQANGDIYLDPPVRLLRQWDSGRWGYKQMAGKKCSPVPEGLQWVGSGCGPTSAAMVMRWFAEDCRAGQVPFPTKKGSTIASDWYPPRLGDCFWPDADPHGKIALLASGPIDNGTLFAACAHYLKSGGNVDASGAVKGAAYQVTSKPSDGWMAEIARLLLFGPVIIGMGDPAPVGHFAVAQGIVGGALLVVDPGKVLYQAARGGKTASASGSGGGAVLINDWKNVAGYVDGAMKGGSAATRAAPGSQWPKGKPPDGENDDGCSCALSGAALNRLMAGLHSVTSFTYKEGAALGGSPQAQPQAVPYTPPPPAPSVVGPDAQPMTGALLSFFTYTGELGESSAPVAHTYNAYRQGADKTPWFIKGRLMIDIDGAPNCYHLTRTDVLPMSKYATDMETWPGPLDSLANGGHPGNWFGFLTDNQEVTGNPVLQKDGDPFPGFCISTTSLADKNKRVNDPTRYADARKIPYIAFPKQIWNEGKTGARFHRVAAGSTGNLGDYVTIINLKDNTSVAQAIIADIGDKPHFGEVSPATAKQLHDFSGETDAKMLYIIYPKSGVGQGTIPDAQTILDTGARLFAGFGGMDEVKRVLALME